MVRVHFGTVDNPIEDENRYPQVTGKRRQRGGSNDARLITITQLPQGNLENSLKVKGLKTPFMWNLIKIIHGTSYLVFVLKRSFWCHFQDPCFIRSRTCSCLDSKTDCLLDIVCQLEIEIYVRCICSYVKFFGCMYAEQKTYCMMRSFIRKSFRDGELRRTMELIHCIVRYVNEGNSTLTKRRGASRRGWMSRAYGKWNVVYHTFYWPHDCRVVFWPFPKTKERHAQS